MNKEATLLKQTYGVLPVYKPAGITSFDVIRQVKKNLGIKKIGHTGTLDKFAEGLLILLHGSYTRLASLFLGQDKEYLACLRLGETTETLDPEGEISARGPVPTLAAIEACLPQFTGVISQVPPRFSAVHVDGKRAYKLARQGENPVLQPRFITIYSLELVKYSPPHLTLRVLCSKGTYIRSLARDLGLAAGSCSYVESLQRTAVGKFKLTDAVDINQLTGYTRNFSPQEIADLLKGIAILRIREAYLPKLFNGAQLEDSFFLQTPQGDGDCFIIDEGGNLLAVVTKTGVRYDYRLVLGRRV